MASEEPAEPLKYQIWVLKVSIHCQGCRRKVKRVLQNIDGVYATDVDSKQNRVTVTGNVDAGTLIRKLAKHGKNAELWPEKPKFREEMDEKGRKEDRPSGKEAKSGRGVEKKGEESSEGSTAVVQEKPAGDKPKAAKKSADVDETKNGKGKGDNLVDGNSWNSKEDSGRGGQTEEKTKGGRGGGSDGGDKKEEKNVETNGGGGDEKPSSGDGDKKGKKVVTAMSIEKKKPPTENNGNGSKSDGTAGSGGGDNSAAIKEAKKETADHGHGGNGPRPPHLPYHPELLDQFPVYRREPPAYIVSYSMAQPSLSYRYYAAAPPMEPPATYSYSLDHQHGSTYDYPYCYPPPPPVGVSLSPPRDSSYDVFSDENANACRLM